VGRRGGSLAQARPLGLAPAPPTEVYEIDKQFPTKKKNYAGSENHSPHSLRKRSQFGTNDNDI